MDMTEVNELGVESNVEVTEAIRFAEQDLNFLAGICLMETMQFLFPKMFIAIWEFMRKEVHKVRAFPKLAIGIPRGFAKTTIVKLWVVFCILFTTKKFIMVVAHEEDHAISIIKDACEMLSSPNVRALFGDWETNKDTDRQDLKIFHFRGKHIILLAIGAKGNIRGKNLGNARPDVIIFEDYQTDEEADNEDLSNALYKRMLGRIMKAASPFGCMYIYVANMYPSQGAILKKLKANKDWLSFIVGAILEDGESLWEELQPIEQLLDEYESDLNAGHPEVFLAEKLNDENAGIKAGVDITKIPKFPFDEYELPQGRAIVIDPALNNPTSDYNGIGLVGLFDGIPWLEQVELGKFTPYELIKKAIILAIKTSTRLICVENKAYQASLLYWFTHIANANGLDGFHFMPLNVGTATKNAKIATGLKELMKMEIGIKSDVRPLLVNEIIQWKPLKKNNKDTVLDLLTFMKPLIKDYQDLMYMPYEPVMQEMGKIEVLTEEENCTF